MVDRAVYEVGKVFWKVSIDLIRKRVIDSIDEGDVSFDKFRHLLISELEFIQEGVNVLRHKDYEVAVSYFRSSLNAMEDGIPEEDIKRDFLKADEYCRLGLATVNSFEDICALARIRIISTMYIHGYFKENKANVHILKECNDLFQQLLHTSFVISSIRDEFGYSTGLASKDTRYYILRELIQIRSFLFAYLNYVHMLPCPDNCNKLLIVKSLLLVM